MNANKYRHGTRRNPLMALTALACYGAIAVDRPVAAAAPETATLQLCDGEGCNAAAALSTEIDVTVTGIIARTRVTQRFHNASSDWVEGVYVFPLPDGAAVDHLVMYVGSRVIEGRIEERTEARRTYEQAREGGSKASLIEQDGGNVFRTSVANIGPDEVIEIDLEMQHLARFDAGEFHLRLPTVLAPRWTAASAGGASHAGAGDEEWTAGMELEHVVTRALHPIQPLRVSVAIDAGLQLRTLYSPSHRIDTVELGESLVGVTLRDDAFSDRDFVLVWRPETHGLPAPAVFHEEIDGAVYALLMLVPPEDTAVPRPLAREVVYVIDTSGSMAGASIRQAKLALLLALDQLRPGDWFDVIEFNDTAHSLLGGSIAATAESIDRIRQAVDRLRASGGTNISDALELALAPGAAPTAVRQVVFITDGAVGNEGQLFSQVAEQIGRNRLFTVGIGAAPNAHFLRKAAQFGRGTYTFIGSPDEVSHRVGVLVAKLETAVLTDIEIYWDDDTPPEIWPHTLTDLYADEPLVVTARLAHMPGRVEVEAVLDGAPWSMVEELQPVDIAGRDRGIGRLWARQKIEALMDDLALGADRDRVREDVVDLALEHNLVTRYTSLVAVDSSPTAPSKAAKQWWLPLNRPVGSLPSTATPAALHALISLLLTAIAASLAPPRRRRRGTANRPQVSHTSEEG